MYREIVDSIIDRSGSECVLKCGDDVAYTKAFITPQKTDGKYFGGETGEEAGVFDERRYLYIGKAEYDLSFVGKECTVLCGENLYFVDHAEIYELYGEALYCRGILRRCLERG